MNLSFNKRLAYIYKSPSQKIRVLTEDWANNNIYCPSCGSPINKYQNNQPVADFHCITCREQYELKSKKDNIGLKILDGAYKTMLERLRSRHNPNFFFLSYGLGALEVSNFLVIPKHFFVPEIIEKRKPLAPHARRAGWIGCNILLQKIPQTGKIFLVRDKKVRPKKAVLETWRKTLFLREETQLNAKGWILDIMNCIDDLRKKLFSLDEVYSFEKDLRLKHPGNKHIKDKIRQQLQFLRDKGYLEFLGKGRYGVI
ncbi:MAG: restriction endonuclease [Candidatus Omnitrophica bacterium]|nr:restriction endonuclease [Candidatus Omnitrophota bacterium]